MSFAAGLEAGLLLGKKFGGGKKEPFRGINGINTIVINYDASDEENPEKVVVKTKTYICEADVYSKSINITKTETDSEGNTTTTSFSESFSKTTIISIRDNDGNTILTSDYDASTGKVSKYYDSDGKEILI